MRCGRILVVLVKGGMALNGRKAVNGCVCPATPRTAVANVVCKILDHGPRTKMIFGSCSCH
jgi:hypothetical protein